MMAARVDRNERKVALPDGVRCAIALSYDTDTAGGYAPDGVCHGRTPPFLHEYMLRLCDAAERYGVKLHFMQIGNGLEEPRVVEYCREVLDRGHVFDNHTYSHLGLNTPDVAALDDELARTNRLFEQRLGWCGSAEEMLADERIEAIYIATNNKTHFPSPGRP